MNQKRSAFMDNRKGRRQSADDMMAGVGLGVDGMDLLRKEIVGHGVLCTYDCARCGRQSKLMSNWPELLSFYRGQRVKGTTPTQQGVYMRVRCPCGRINRLVWGWDEILNYLRHAVRAGQLPPAALQMAPGAPPGMPPR